MQKANKNQLPAVWTIKQPDPFPTATQQTLNLTTQRLWRALTPPVLPAQRGTMTNPPTKTWARTSEREEKTDEWAAVDTKATCTLACFCLSSCLETCPCCCVALWQALHPRACGSLSAALPPTELSDELLFKTAQVLCCPTGAPHSAHRHASENRSSLVAFHTFRKGQKPETDLAVQIAAAPHTLGSPGGEISPGSTKVTESIPCAIPSAPGEAWGRWLLTSLHCAPHLITLKNSEDTTVSGNTSSLWHWFTGFP